MTIIIVPETPDLPGTPTEKAHSPEKSYIPHMYIIDRQYRTVSSLKTRLLNSKLGFQNFAYFLVSGFTPPFAKVAAITYHNLTIWNPTK